MSSMTAVFLLLFTVVLLSGRRGQARARYSGSTGTPGPIVVATAMVAEIVALGGRRLGAHQRRRSAPSRCRSASRGRRRPCRSARGTMPAFSTRYSTLPALTSRTASADVERHRTDLRVRHQTTRTEHLSRAGRRRPSCRASRSRCRSRASSPPGSSWSSSSPPAKSAPASSASLTFSPLAMTRTRTVLPVPCGSMTVPRTF